MLFWKYIKNIINEQKKNSKEESQNQDSNNNSNEESQNQDSSSNSNGKTKNQNSNNNSNEESQSQNLNNNSNEESQSQDLNNNSKEEFQNQDLSNNSNGESQNQNLSNNSKEEFQNQDLSSNSNEEPQTQDLNSNLNRESQTQDSSSNLNRESQSQDLNSNSNEEPQTQDSSYNSNGESQTQDLNSNLNRESQTQDSSNNSNEENQSQDSSSNLNRESQTQDSNNNLNEKIKSYKINEKIRKDYINDSSYLSQRKEKLQQLRDKLQEYIKRKQEKLEKQNLSKNHLNNNNKNSIESKEEDYKLSEQTNKFLDKLKDLPSFKDRDRNPGYSIDTEGYTELPDSLVRTLITKFLNQRFCKKNTDLNIRSNSLEKTSGFYKWEVKDVIVHLNTHQITKVLNDKYGYQYADGKNENVPLSFYFDMSGSMSSYTNMLSVIAIELLKKDVKVLVGYNERVNVQIDSINKNIDVKELANILESVGCSNNNDLVKDSRVIYKFVNQNIDNYLLSKKAEKCVIFADFDPCKEVINLSHKVRTYWFCFENEYNFHDVSEFSGFIYKVRNANDIMNGLIKVNENRFESLAFTENQKQIKKTKGGNY